MIERVITNRFDAPCATCRQAVSTGAGYAVLNGKWATYHNSDKCLPADAQAKIGAVAGPASTARTLGADGVITMPYDPNAMPLLRSMPGARWDAARKVWTVSLDPAHRARVLELADKLSLTVDSALLAPVSDPAADAALARAAASKAFPFQHEGIRFLATGKRRLLGDEMGLGKTVQALLAIPAGGRALVVVPATLKFNWRDEARRWRPDLTVAVLAGKGSFRWPGAGEIVVLNPEILPNFVILTDRKVTVDEAKIGAAGMAAAAQTILIADEAHLYKSHDAKRSQHMRVLQQVCGTAWAMTGTPLLNDPLDLWGMLNSFGLAQEVFGGWMGFLRCFRGVKGRWGGYDFGAPLPEVPERLRRVMLRRLRAEVLPDLPGKTRQYLPVNGIDKALGAKMDALMGEWGECLGDDELPPFEAFSEIRAELAAARIPALTELVETYEAQGMPVVVASAHRAPVEALAQRTGWAAIYGGVTPEERNRIVRDFQAGKLRGIALTIKAGGVGLTLTAASHMIFADLDWTPALNLQCEDRICRIGQTVGAVNYQILVTDHPLDRRVTEILAQKMTLIEAAIERTVGAVVPKATAPCLPGVQHEDEAAFAKRMAAVTAAEAAVTKAQARVKLNGYNASHGGAEIEAPDAAKREVIVAALDYMLGRCDGAETLDGEGFNKPDAMRSRWLACFDLRADDTAATAALLMLRGYHRQLGAAFPGIFA